MTGKLFFTGDGEGNIQDLHIFGTLAQFHLRTYGAAHNLHLECLLVSLFGLALTVKTHLLTLTRMFIEKQTLRTKYARNTEKKTCEGAIAKIYYIWFTIIQLNFSGTRNFRMLSKLSEQSLEVTPLYLPYARHKTHKTLLISLVRYPCCPINYS